MNAIVTGANRGIGMAIAHQLFLTGWRVEKWSRTLEGIDISESLFGVPLPEPLDAIIHCAAIMGFDDRRTFDVNCWGTVNVLETMRPVMVKQGFGSIILFSGGGACYGTPGFAAYGASKTAVVRLAETYALELGPHGVRVNAVAPGWQDTNMGRQFKAMGGKVRTEGTLPEVWELVRWLLSDESRHVTGRLVHIRDDYRNWPNPLPDDWAKLRRVEPHE